MAWKTRKIMNHDSKKEGFLGKPGTSKRRANIGCLIIIMAMIALAIFIRSMELWV